MALSAGSSSRPVAGVVRRAQQGDLAAFDALVSDHLDRSFRFACTVLGNEDDARDAVQDAYLSAWRDLPRLREPKRFDGWLGRIVLNACRQTLRRRGRVREISLGGLEPDVTPDRRTAAGPDQVDRRDALERALDRLTLDQRAILALHHLEDRPVREIAARFGVPVGTAKWRLHAARRALVHAISLEDA